MNALRTRPTAPFTIFYRTLSADGGYACHTCSARRHDTFPRASDVFAVAAQHLNLCRAALRHRPVEGTAIIDGVTHGVVLRESILLLTLHSVFEPGGAAPARVVA